MYLLACREDSLTNRLDRITVMGLQDQTDGETFGRWDVGFER